MREEEQAELDLNNTLVLLADTDDGIPRTAMDEGKLLIETGIERCRRGEWGTGLNCLGKAADPRRRTGELPSLLYSYLGYGMARNYGRIEEGIRLCRHAVKMEFYQIENYVNLARALLLAERRRAASQAVDRGLSIDPNHPELLALSQEMGSRRAPVLPFLSRRNILNRILGRVRHDLTTPSPKKDSDEVVPPAGQAPANKRPARTPKAKTSRRSVVKPVATQT